MNSDIYDETEEEQTFEDSYADADKDETLPELQQENISNKPVRKISSMSKQKMQVPKSSLERRKTNLLNIQIKSDSLRKRFDIRNKKKK